MVLFLKILAPNKYWDKKCDFHDKYLTRDGQEMTFHDFGLSFRHVKIPLNQSSSVISIFPLSLPYGQTESYSNTDCLNSLVQKRADFEYFQNLSCPFKRFEKWTDTGNKFNFRRSRKREYVRILASSWMFWTILRSGLRTSDWVFHMYIQTMHRNLLNNFYIQVDTAMPRS